MITKLINKDLFAGQLLQRANNTHKGDYGHLCLVCGCDSMPGAASLATGAALRSGCGLVTLHTSAYAAQISAVSNPSAILSIDSRPFFSDGALDWGRYSAVAVGPGLGRQPLTEAALRELLTCMKRLSRPMVIDADAINIIAAHRDMLGLVPAGSVLTPHDGELSRLFPWNDDDEKAAKIQEFTDRFGCIVVAKGYHSRVFIAGQHECYENTTGNPGMAKGGSGDVLTGLIGGLIARGYDSAAAAKLGVWIHGYAGDCCSSHYGLECFNSLDLINSLHLGFMEIG